jgi:hypothetical protein
MTMQPLDLNLASQPFRNNTLLWTGYAAAIVLLAAFSTWSVVRWDEHRRLLRDKRDEVGTFESQRQDLERRAREAQAGIRQHDLESLGLQAAKANEVIDWKAFSWTRLFNHLERVQPWQVRMNSIRPMFHAAARASANPQQRAEAQTESMPVQIEGTARTYADFAELEQALQADPHFGRVEPERASRADSGEIVFVLRFQYYPLAGDAAAEPEVEPAGPDAPDEATADAGTPPAAVVATGNGAP